MQIENIPPGLSKLRNNNSAFWIMLVIALATTFFSYHPGLFTKFELYDDHHRIRMATDGPVHDQIPEGEKLIPSLLGRGDYPGRFTPLITSTNHFFAYSFGLNPFLWHIVPLIYALATVIFLFLAASRFFRSFWVGGMLAIWILQVPDLETWVYIARGGHIGMVFLSACLFFNVYASHKPYIGKWDLAGLVCFAGASLCKESFLLLAPALLYMIWYLKNESSPSSHRMSFKSLSIIIFLYALWSILLLSMIFLMLIFSKGKVVDGGFFLKNTTIIDFVKQLCILSYIPKLSLWFIPIMGFVLWSVKNKSYKNLYAYRYIAIFIFLWVAPQIVLYGARGGFRGRYWLPMIVGFCLLNAIALKKLMKENSARNICVIVWLLVALLTIRCVQINWSQSVNFKSRTHAFENMIKDVVSHVPDNGNIVVVANSADPAYAVVHRLGVFGKPHVNAYLYQTDGAITDGFCFPEKGDPDVLTPEEIDAVIYFKPGYRDIAQRQRWYKRERFSLHKSIEKEIYLSLRKLSLVSFDYGYEYDLSTSAH